MLAIEPVTKVFSGGQVALEDVTLQFAPGEITALVGPSGCGKNTLLHLIVGLGRPISGPTPEIGIVSQEPRLLPWLKVAENIHFGLGKRPPTDTQRRVKAALEKSVWPPLPRRWPGPFQAACPNARPRRAAVGQTLQRFGCPEPRPASAPFFTFLGVGPANIDRPHA